MNLSLRRGQERGDQEGEELSLPLTPGSYGQAGRGERAGGGEEEPMLARILEGRECQGEDGEEKCQDPALREGEKAEPMRGRAGMDGKE